MQRSLRLRESWQKQIRRWWSMFVRTRRSMLDVVIYKSSHRQRRRRTRAYTSTYSPIESRTHAHIPGLRVRAVCARGAQGKSIEPAVRQKCLSPWAFARRASGSLRNDALYKHVCVCSSICLRYPIIVAILFFLRILLSSLDFYLIAQGQRAHTLDIFMTPKGSCVRRFSKRRWYEKSRVISFIKTRAQETLKKNVDTRKILMSK